MFFFFLLDGGFFLYRFWEKVGFGWLGGWVEREGGIGWVRRGVEGSGEVWRKGGD